MYNINDIVFTINYLQYNKKCKIKDNALLFRTIKNSRKVKKTI